MKQKRAVAKAAPVPLPRTITLLGATGSIGTSTADLLRRDPARYAVEAVTANRDAAALARELDKRRIVVAARHGNLRVSPHFYNDESDLAALARGL